MKTSGSAVGRPVFGVAGVQMQDRGAALGRSDCIGSDLVRSDRQIG